ncbi:MAG: DEAD/DEAH box helicase [Aquihabitans sp.]
MSAEPFALDRFQVEALAAIDAGHNVLVAAPTGAGKTVVAEHAVAAALAAGRRAFYTTPIKALSNQKFADLVNVHGADQVGLLTGDNAINPGAGVVVMTTEVLRNMIYADSPELDDLDWVVLDEVHYLQDTYRGPVWEEVLIHAPGSVRFVCLSATVSNAEELAGWIGAARGDIDLVVETERPVELVNHFLVFDKGSGELVQVETLVGGRPNPEGDRFDGPAAGADRNLRYRDRTRQRFTSPRRTEVVDHLRNANLLPAIYFIFSRAACDDAAKAVLNDGGRLTTEQERARIRIIAEHHVEHLSDDDLAVLGYGSWLAGLEAGVAAHHAGMVPPFKEAVEACFVEGLVKVVFATETLALGINMPARSVIIETLSKFTGETHEDLTPSQYTQLTGRAGRRGLDPVGHALVLWSPWYGFDKVAALAASREFVLRSAFKPTPNMVVNLMTHHDRDAAHELIGRSFAQYQADRSTARLVHRRAKQAALLAEAETEARCDRGDLDEYRDLRRAERAAARADRQSEADRIEVAMDRLQPGDIIYFGPQRYAILSASHRRGSIRLRVIDPDGHVSSFDPEDFDEAPVGIGAVRLPEPFDPRNRIIQRRVAAGLRKADLGRRAGAGQSAAAKPNKSRPNHAADHPVASCPDLDAHLQAAGERDRLRNRVADLDGRLEERSTSLRRQFDRITKLLERWGFVDGWQVTDRGRVLSRVFHESDLLCAAVVCDGLLDDLDPASMAGLVSTLTYEHRSKEPPPPPWFPSKLIEERTRTITRLAADIAKNQTALGLPPTRPPDPSFLALAHGWASGGALDTVLADEDLSGGDFVRNVKTLIDLLRQVATVSPNAETRRSARSASDALFRGVVSASSEVTGSGAGGPAAT